MILKMEYFYEKKLKHVHRGLHFIEDFSSDSINYSSIHL